MKRCVFLRVVRLLVVVSVAAGLSNARIGLACMQEYEKKKEEEKRDEQWEHYQEQKHSANEYLVNLLDGAESNKVSDERLAALAEAAEHGDYRDRTNFGVALVRRGRYAEARDLFAQIEEEHPGEY